MTDKRIDALAEVMAGLTGYPVDSATVKAFVHVARSHAASELLAAADELPITPGLQYVAHGWLRNRAAQIEAEL